MSIVNTSLNYIVLTDSCRKFVFGLPHDFVATDEDDIFFSQFDSRVTMGETNALHVSSDEYDYDTLVSLVLDYFGAEHEGYKTIS